MKTRKEKKEKKRIKHAIRYSAAILLAAYLCLCFSQRLSVRDPSFAEESHMLYYMVNTDGMKGLGHSILMLVDEEGCGTVLSFNGMQRSLWESLMGKSGVGKMSMGTMSAEETTAFLQSGDLHIDGDQLTDNYDMALYRPITEKEYHAILERTAPYLAAEEQFGILYEKWALEEDAGKKAEYKQELEQMGQDDTLPLYRIYTNNCDHAARLLVSGVDPQMQDYIRHAWRMTPNGNLKAFGREAKEWGVMALGKQSLAERILLFLMIF